MQRVLSKQHQINKQNVTLKLYYKNFGLNPLEAVEYSQYYQYYNNKTTEKVRQITLKMNMKNDKVGSPISKSNKNSLKSSEKVVKPATADAIKSKHQSRHNVDVHHGASKQNSTN